MTFPLTDQIRALIKERAQCIERIATIDVHLAEARELLGLASPDSATAPIRRRVDVIGKAPDPFALNVTCAVCGEGFHRNGPRQKVCVECRTLKPGAKVDELKAIRAGTAAPRESVKISAVQLDCYGPGTAQASRCPLGKIVRKDAKARGPLRCPDCQMEYKRRLVRDRLPDLRTEQRERLEAIERTPAFAVVFDGRGPLPGHGGALVRS